MHRHENGQGLEAVERLDSLAPLTKLTLLLYARRVGDPSDYPSHLSWKETRQHLFRTGRS